MQSGLERARGAARRCPSVIGACGRGPTRLTLHWQRLRGRVHGWQRAGELHFRAKCDVTRVQNWSEEPRSVVCQIWISGGAGMADRSLCRYQSFAGIALEFTGNLPTEKP
jgi:hypothetical protein